MPTIVALQNELLDKVQELSAFKDRGFTIYNLDEIGDIASEGTGFPLVATAYLGTIPRDNSAIGTSGAKSSAGDVIMVHKQFAILVAVEYNWSDSEDTKPVATDLLDAIRGKLLGFHGVNSRPWQLVDEGPAESGISGAILYMQTWATLCHDKGNSA